MNLDALQREAQEDGRRCVVGALILDGEGRVFVHRRGLERAFLPGGWDLVGGHVEEGETLLGALEREVLEESGWRLVGSPQLVFVGDWVTDPEDPASARREFDFLVEVDGDLARPRLERPKHVEFRWIGEGEVQLLDENRGGDDGLVRHLVELALRSASAAASGLGYPHATIFLDLLPAEPVEKLRHRWDPALAGQIGAHVTLAYPSEVSSIERLAERARVAAPSVTPFTLRLGAVNRQEGRHEWVGVDVDDAEGGWLRLRKSLVPASLRRADIAPHVTVVHPRHSNLGAQAWRAIGTRRMDGAFTATDVEITAFDGRVWRTIERFPLGRG